MQKHILIFILFYSLSLLVNANPNPVDFNLKGLDGKTYQLADYRGKWVIVNYWATWCPPCLAELSDLELFHTNNELNAVVLGINMEKIKLKKLQNFIEEQFISYPILLSKSIHNSIFGQITSLPTTVIINPEGQAVAVHRSQISAELLTLYIKLKIKKRLKQAALKLTKKDVKH